MIISEWQKYLIGEWCRCIFVAVLPLPSIKAQILHSHFIVISQPQCYHLATTSSASPLGLGIFFFNMKNIQKQLIDRYMVYIDLVASYINNYHENKTFLCLETSTNVSMNRCRGCLKWRLYMISVIHFETCFVDTYISVDKAFIKMR